MKLSLPTVHTGVSDVEDVDGRISRKSGKTGSLNESWCMPVIRIRAMLKDVLVTVHTGVSDVGDADGRISRKLEKTGSLNESWFMPVIRIRAMLKDVLVSGVGTVAPLTGVVLCMV